jgi:uncharacterized SAM-binding protein YcdF (DUF218 family)
MKTSCYRWLKRLVLLAFVAGVLVVCLAPDWALPPLARFLDVSQTPRPVDFVLVLNGDPEARPFAAGALVKVGLAGAVLLTQPRESASAESGLVLSELETNKKILRARGVAEEKIHVLPGDIDSTGDEARALAAFLRDNKQATVAVVTSAFHTRRARMVFHRLLGQDAARVSFIGIPSDGVDEESWWCTPQGCAVYVSEYCKLPYYWLRY